MVHTRQSAGFALQAAQLETPKVVRADGLEKYFEQFTQQEGITLPYQERNSPSKRRKSPGHDVVQKFSYLYFKDKRENTSTLSRALRDFRLRSPALNSNDDKLNLLLEALSIAVDSVTKKNGTPRSPHRQCHRAPSPKQNGQHHFTSMGPPTSVSKMKGTPVSSHWPPPSLQSTQLRNNRNDPPSPTLSILHAPKVPLGNIPKMRLDDIVKYPKLPPPMDPAKSFAGITSLNTSFTTTTSASTSFWSEAQGSQEPASPATSIDSISCLDGANDVNDQASQDTSYYGTPPNINGSSIPGAVVTPAVTGTQGTDYGTINFGESQFDPDTPSKRLHMNGATQQNSHMSPSSRKMLPSPYPTDKHTNAQAIGPTNETDMAADPQEHFRVKRIPTDGITGCIIMTSALSILSFELQWEGVRVMQACDFTIEQLETQWQSPRTFASLRELAKQLAPSSFQSMLKKDYKNCSFHAKLRWTASKDKSKPLFNVELLPPGHEDHNGWQLDHGSNTFLFIELDPLRKPPKHLDLQNQKDNIVRQVQNMLDLPQGFLGRTWKQFHIQEKKSKKRGDADATRSGAHNLYFFATGGDKGKLPQLSLRDILDPALPFAENMLKPLGKSFARLDLFASRTSEAFQVNPNEIEWVDDDYATEDPPDTQFNNEQYALEFEANEVYRKKTVMNDGCSEVPAWTLRQIGIALKLGYTPSAAQFRCAGAKGMIFRDRTADEDEEHSYFPPRDFKLRITKSQSKVVPKKLDSTVGVHHKAFYTLRINAVSHVIGPSFLYTDFLEILVACGVLPVDIEKLVLRQANSFSEELLSAIESRERFRLWIDEQSFALGETRRDDDIAMRAGFPLSGIEKAIQMLESGFEPTEFAPLANTIQSEIKLWTDFMIRAFKLMLPRSTMAYAIADKSGILEPGEVHLCFSNTFHDRTTTTSWSALDCSVLIGRNPAARASDIQRLKAVYKQELSHIQDVIVFSKKGPRPLADKLSGGDYDGDKFWVCWEPLLVKSFKNVPAPQQLPDPTTLGIEVDKRQLGDVVQDPQSEEQLREFVRIGTESRMRSNWLGVMTLIHKRVVHIEGLLTPRAIKLTNMKDLLMDSDKNGFIFRQEALEAFKKDNDLLNLPTPAYFEYTNSKDPDDEDSTKYESPKYTNIVDRIYFWTLKPRFEATLRLAVQKLGKDSSPFDPRLTAFYNDMEVDAQTNPTIQAELKHLERKLQELRVLWAECMSRFWAAKNTKQHKKASELWQAAIVDCREFFCSIEPVAGDSDPTIKEWMRPCGHALTIWVRLKASALAKFHRSNSMWYNIAAAELCQLKVDSLEQSRTLTKSAYMALVPRKRKRVLVGDDGEVEAEETELDVGGPGQEGDAAAGAD